MKILFLNYEYPPLGGGTGIANYYLLKEFSKTKNLQLDVLTSSVNKYKKERFSKNIRIFRLNVGKRNKNLHHQTAFDLINYFIQSTVFALKNRNQYDLIHAFSGLPGGITAYLSSKPYIISLRGTEVPGYEDRFGWVSRLIKPLIMQSWRKAKFVDANSQYLKKLALKTNPDLNIKVVYNGVDTKSFYPAKKNTKDSVILCNSRLGKRKGVEYLVKAIPMVLNKIPRARLVLIGEGAEKEKLIKLVKELNISKKVRFLGKLEHNRLPDIYRKSGFFVLPSLSESLSNSLLEALASGLPIVATKVGGNPELVGKINGVLVPLGEVQSLAKAIIKLLRNKNLSKKMGQNSRLIAEKYSWGKTAAMYFRLYSY